MSDKTFAIACLALCSPVLIAGYWCWLSETSRAVGEWFEGDTR